MAQKIGRFAKPFILALLIALFVGISADRAFGVDAGAACFFLVLTCGSLVAYVNWDSIERWRVLSAPGWVLMCCAAFAGAMVVVPSDATDTDGERSEDRAAESVTGIAEVGSYASTSTPGPSAEASPRAVATATPRPAPTATPRPRPTTAPRQQAFGGVTPRWESDGLEGDVEGLSFEGPRITVMYGIWMNDFAPNIHREVDESWLSDVGRSACEILEAPGASPSFGQRVQEIRSVLVDNASIWGVPATSIEFDVTTVALVGTGCPIWTNEVLGYLDS